jgi:phosphatidylinositol glycan class U
MISSYLLNPYLIFPSLALSTSTLDNALCVFTLLSASKGTPKCPQRLPLLMAV